jgi:hypothetical protein
VPTVRQLLQALQLGNVLTLYVDPAALPNIGTAALSSLGSGRCAPVRRLLLEQLMQKVISTDRPLTPQEFLRAGLNGGRGLLMVL